jgi:hypothetical protein
MHIMLDLETLGTAPGCPILSIGAVSFCRSGVGVGVKDTFYRAVKLPENPTVSSATLLWWLDQSEEARHTLIDDQEAAPSAEEALKAFSSWVESMRLGGVRFDGFWANGASFDLPIIESAMREVGVDVPWPFYMHRCFRTMKGLPGADAADVKPEFKGTAHNALDDAIHQAHWLVHIHHKITPCL